MKPWQLLPLFIFLLLCFFLWKGLSLDSHLLPSTRIGQQVPPFHLAELDHPEKTISRDVFTHQVKLLNVWASWCQACIDEQAFMMQLADEGVAIIGLNYKDKQVDARKWLASYGDPYQLILQDKHGKLALDLGVYGAPETYVIDKHGIIRYRHVGPLDKDAWRQIKPLMQIYEQQT
jgi:cytochrome c biogenesis protein CcmG/thiol:disulfide interchange protein DsbE